MESHDYQSRSIYMITICVTGRRPLLGALRDGPSPWVEPTELGVEVERCWHAIPVHYPEVRLLEFQLMPDHVHGLLFVERKMESHLGQIIKGFKIGCSKAKWRLEEALPGSRALNYNSTHKTSHKTPHDTPATSRREPLFESGYHDSVLKGAGQLERMFRYIKDNPRRLATKRKFPDMFKVVAEVEVNGTKYAAVGNRWLLDRPVRMQVCCHNNTSQENLHLIARQKEYFLAHGKKGGVVVSPCISPGEKEIAHAALDAGVPLIVILENGFPTQYKPPGKYFDACASGLLLMLAPWPHHAGNRKITRIQCLALNDMARAISTEPWTSMLETYPSNHP